VQIVRQQTPEDRELETKRATLAALESDLATRELELATLHATLNAFEKKYLSIVGKRYAELDEILAQIAEAQARLNPKDQKANQKAAEVRQQAQESARAAAAVDDAGAPTDFQPSETLKKLYRQVAKALHPDLANTDEDRARRHAFMARANQAYEAGDEQALHAILREWQSSPESVVGEGVGAELVRTIRKISRIEDRLRAINTEIEALKNSSLFTLKTKADEAEKQNRDLLAETASRLAEEIAEARARLSQLIQETQ
jgi:peptidoglycan hydrolase CwlO-like protein